MPRLSTIVLGSLVTILFASSSMAQGAGECPNKVDTGFLFIEWDLRQNATMTAQDVSNVLGAQLADVLSQTPGFVQLMSMPIGESTVRIIALFSNTQQAIEARNTVGTFILNNLISQVTLVLSLSGTVAADVLNPQICDPSLIEHTGRFLSIREFQRSPSLSNADVVSATVPLNDQLQGLPGFRESFTMGVGDSNQVLFGSVWNTQSEALDAGILTENATLGPQLSGRLQLVGASVTPITFDQFSGF